MIQDLKYFQALSNSNNFGHIGFVVPNMDKAMKRWIQSGAEIIIEPTFDPIQNVWCSFLVCFSSLPIELVAPSDSGNSPLVSRLKKGGGLDHICLFVNNVDEAFQQELDRGGLELCSPVYGCVWDRTIAFVGQRTGLVLELMSKDPEGKLLEDPLNRSF